MSGNENTFAVGLSAGLVVVTESDLRQKNSESDVPCTEGAAGLDRRVELCLSSPLSPGPLTQLGNPSAPLSRLRRQCPEPKRKAKNRPQVRHGLETRHRAARLLNSWDKIRTRKKKTTPVLVAQLIGWTSVIMQSARCKVCRY